MFTIIGRALVQNFTKLVVNVALAITELRALRRNSSASEVES